MAKVVQEIVEFENLPFGSLFSPKCIPDWIYTKKRPDFPGDFTNTYSEDCGYNAFSPRTKVIVRHEGDVAVELLRRVISKEKVPYPSLKPGDIFVAGSHICKKTSDSAVTIEGIPVKVRKKRSNEVVKLNLKKEGER